MFHKGVLMMLLSSVLFSIMSAMVKWLSSDHHVSSYIMAVVRFTVGSVAMVAIFAAGLSEMRWNNWRWIVARGVSGGLAVVLFFWCIEHIGLGKAVLFSYTYVIFAALFAVPFLKERITAAHWVCIAVAMIGIVLLCDVKGFAIQANYLLAILCGLLSGFAVVCVTKCRSTDSSANILWSQCLFGLVIVAWPATTHWAASPTLFEWVAMLVIALFATAGQLFMTYAYKYTGATHGSLLSLLSPVLGTAIGYLYFKEPLGPTFFVGAALILLACCYLSFNPVSQAVEEAADLEE
jgi:drug/metabolite transporter (DMT)-like permease